ncbi:MAG: HAMP domain-containing histidine kinase [Phycisphaerales bacterium]|nr:HAMP domain-containing histidine kinase [Phycisphaerales bacterium]
MRRGISLANKCLLLFGGAIVLIIVASSSGPFLRMNALVDDGQLELSREMVGMWERLDRESRGAVIAPRPDGSVEHAGITARRVEAADLEVAAASDPFLARAVEKFRDDPQLVDYQSARWKGTTRDYRYAKAIRSPQSRAITSVLLLDRQPFAATRLLMINAFYLLAAGMVVLALAVLVFYEITHRLILSPVRQLRRTAERVREGDLAIRSDISTGDEFQELAETFNSMLTDLQSSQEQLRGINTALDLKLNELAQTNVALFEAAKLKGDFLASVSHELRTPLNSIIGFAELLLEIARGEAQSAEPPAAVAKRIRYNENIVNAGRNLLEMINSLLEMAKIEAGKTEVHVARMVGREACDGLAGLIHPLAERKGIAVKLEIGDDVPVVATDIKKFRQIVFNFLSNAVKFTEPLEKTGRPGQVILRAERLLGGADTVDERVRVSVIDNGPGIPPEQQRIVFEKFRQLDTGHTREHTGTGLGLAICKELANILQAEIQLVSDLGRGSMFSLILPLRLDPTATAESQLEARFKGALAGRASWAS